MDKKTLIDVVTIELRNRNSISPSEEEIKECVDKFNTVFMLETEIIEQAIIELHARLRVRLEMGHMVFEKGHRPWFNNRKPQLEMLFWNRYHNYLLSHEGFSPNVANTIDKVTDELIDLMGDPKIVSSFNRRGLVMGDVQSGKTSNYTALICKAADAGYKVVILLTGMLENLRRQTQQRLDEGFVGMDSACLINNHGSVYIGVGDTDARCHACVLTSTENDFKRTQPGMKISSVNEPILFVIKKNKTPLLYLERWLKLYNLENGSIDAPVLIIDDESDNASVNTKNPEEEPGQINIRIRSLLKLFSKATYVGFTATPFANIFIDPDTESEMYDDDLFPRDFVYSLNSPSNYVSPTSIFINGGENKFMIRVIDDAESILPYSLKKDDSVATLPKSLYKAVNAFFIANAIRDLRGDIDTHRSMLVNVSRLSNIQEQVANLIDERVRKIQLSIKNYAMQDVLKATAIPEIGELQKCFFEEYKECEFDWEKVQVTLCKSALSIFVTSINSLRKANKFRYDDYEKGAKVIAVGGDCLSRGLTLEGLCISYFYRNSKVYDTLMQMGRWFGYRENYKDISRIWLTEEAVEWYGHIAQSTNELRNEVKLMFESGSTPKEFGLKVRCHPDSLIVTARNKMRAGQNYRKTVSLSETVVETPIIFRDIAKNEENYENFKIMLSDIKKEGIEITVSDFNNPIILNVSKKIIIEYLRKYNSHYLNIGFKTDDLCNFIEKYSGKELEKWDIAFMQGASDFAEIIDDNRPIRMVMRSFSYNEDIKAIRVSGASSRLGSALATREGLSKLQYERIMDEFKANKENWENGKLKGINQELFVRKIQGRKPLLTIYLVELKPKKDNEEERIIKDSFIKPIVGLSIMIPMLTANDQTKYIDYIINVTAWRQLFEGEIDDYLEEESNDDQC